MKSKITKLILLLGIFLLIDTKVYSANISMQVAPPYFDIVAKKDQTIPASLSFTNLGDSGYFVIDIIQDKPIVVTSKNTKNEFFMKTNDTLNFDMSIQIPAIIREKDFYPKISITSLANNNSQSQKSVNIDTRVQVPILIAVSENGLMQSAIKLDRCEPIISNNLEKLIYNNLRILPYPSNTTFDCHLSNVGQYRTKISTQITNINSGNKVWEKNYPLQVVLSGNEYVLTTEKWEVDQISKAKLMIPKIIFGQNKLNFEVNHSETKDKWIAKVSFYAIPYYYLFLLIFVILGTIGVIKRKKHFKDHINKKHNSYLSPDNK